MSQEKTKFIVGLGNPGHKYQATRHNLGFLIVKAFADQCRFKFVKSVLWQGFVAQGEIDGQKIFLLLPLEFMNQSGGTIKAALRRRHIEVQNLLVILDDINLEFGQLRLKPKGSDGGHKGLRSLIEALKTEDFARLRCGIGRPKRKDDVTEYVLSEFNAKEKKELNRFIERAGECCRMWLNEGTVKAMNAFNKRNDDE